ncbi:MAG: hypothetical protein D6702_05810, partial [Planctomycetota bacterium]
AQDPAAVPAPPPAAATAGDPDFVVDYSASGRPIATGLGRGINDLSNASAGAWRAWAEVVRPRGGLARIWLSYAIAPLGPQIEAGLRARDAGLSVFLVVVGAPENQGKGHGEAGTGIPPRDPRAWARHVARDVRRMQAAGVPVSHVEVWNEPDFPGQWNGSEDDFARFFAVAGRELAGELPEVAIGGPGMAGPAGAPMGFFARILAACARAGWSPAFLSYHFYGSYPSDNERCAFGARLERLAADAGLERPEIILSEWNLGLPKPVRPELDRAQAGVYFVAMNTSLAATPVRHSLFFFLQDGYWEAKEDYAGESVGVFTLRGGPKAVLNGMRMFRTAAELPRVPVERRAAPWNLTCLATRAGDRGYLLLANAPGDGVKRARHYVDSAGVDLSRYNGRERQIQAWAAGRISYERMGGRPEDRPVWEEARRLLQETRVEQAATDRVVRLRFVDPPRHLRGVWALDPSHSDPAGDPAFLERFRAAVAALPERAADQVLDGYRAAGLEPARLDALAEAFAAGDPDGIRAGLERRRSTLGPDLAAEAGRRFRDAFLALRDGLPLELIRDPAVELDRLPPRRALRRDGDDAVVPLPPWSAVLIELSWREEEGGGEG